MSILRYLKPIYSLLFKVPQAFYLSTKNEFLQDFDQLNEQKKQHWEYHQKEMGKVYSVKPIKVKCRKGNIYLWCSCGYSKSQPFCDGTHRDLHYKITLKPVPFTAATTKEYYFCSCKQTKNRPFCDGSHRDINLNKVFPTVK